MQHIHDAGSPEGGQQWMCRWVVAHALGPKACACCAQIGRIKTQPHGSQLLTLCHTAGYFRPHVHTCAGTRGQNTPPVRLWQHASEHHHGFCHCAEAAASMCLVPARSATSQPSGVTDHIAVWLPHATRNCCTLPAEAQLTCMFHIVVQGCV